MFNRTLLEKVCTEMNEVMGLTEELNCDLQDDGTLLDTIIWEARGRGEIKDTIRVDDFITDDETKKVFSKEVARFFVDAGVWDSETKTVIMEDAAMTEEPNTPTATEEQQEHDEMEAGESVDETPVPKRVKAKKSTSRRNKKEGDTVKKKDNKVKNKKTTEAKVKSPGVIATIVDLVCNHGPITKEKIVATLIKKFPDRDAKSMAKTVNVQIPGRIQKEQGIKLVEIEDKGWKKK